MSSTPGALLLLLLAVYLLLSYFTGRLDWLFSLGHDVATGYRGGATPTPGAPTSIPTPTPLPARQYA